LIFGALIPLAVASTAWACGLLASLKSSATVANPGQTVTVTGTNYSNDVVTNTPVQIRWNSRTGPVIEDAIPVQGRINEQVTLPTGVSPGWYQLTATQNRISDGQPRQGTPGRTTIRIQGAGAAAASPWGAGPGGGATVALDGDPGAPALLPTLAGVLLSLGLLGGGLTLVGRGRTRRANRPLPGV
jgi:hypothetical protein